MEPQGEGHAINAGRFHGDPNAGSLGRELLEQLTMSGRSVGIGLETRWSVPIRGDGDNELAGTDIDRGPEEGRLGLLHSWFGFMARVRFPDLA